MTPLASQARENLKFPVSPLIATLATQSLATMAAYSFPVVAPVIAQDLQVPGTLVGFFISTVYGVGIISALLSPRFIRRFGAVRVSQLVLIATLAMLLACSVGSVASVVIGAALLGLAYGATAPASAHLLVPRTPPRVMNLVLSIRQIGVPLGGVMAGLIMAPMTLSFGWQTALLWQTVPVIVAILLLELARRDWDSDRDPTRQILSKGLLAPVQILFDRPELRRLALASFVYSGLQLCFIAFLTVHLTSKTGFNLVQAGWALAVYQLAAVVSRPIWGWLADKWLSAKLLLAWQGFIMGAAALLSGQFTESWSPAPVLMLCAVAGATASGFTGLAYAEWARLGGAQRTEATGLGSGLMFAGVLLLPSLFSVAVTYFDDFSLPYAIVGGLAALSGWLLLRQKGT
ncbi:MFS transporter [Zwartia vadi]|uniref:MFS transporter n=1 Tax=Zwartia vadi TaxID=3058168 RepID=UPI0025B2A71E|nr:MFS transporter [Zwartia vadi]MDN3986776.1 MFS transporter [Zwartia vadi]